MDLILINLLITNIGKFQSFSQSRVYRLLLEVLRLLGQVLSPLVALTRRIICARYVCNRKGNCVFNINKMAYQLSYQIQNFIYLSCTFRA